MSAQVLRWQVPVDDQWHRIVLPAGHDVAHVGCRRADAVDFWTVPPAQQRTVSLGTGEIVSERYDYDIVGQRDHAYEFIVRGTGRPFTDGGYVGTVVAPGGLLVWHLFRRAVAS